MRTYEEAVAAIKAQDIDTLVMEKPAVLQSMLKDPWLLERVGAEVEGGIHAVRHLIYTAWFWSYCNSQTGKTGIPTVVRENLNWKPTPIEDPLAATYGII
jgi:hypothetical protein